MKTVASRSICIHDTNVWVHPMIKARFIMTEDPTWPSSCHWGPGQWDNDVLPACIIADIRKVWRSLRLNYRHRMRSSSIWAHFKFVAWRTRHHISVSNSWWNTIAVNYSATWQQPWADASNVSGLFMERGAWPTSRHWNGPLSHHTVSQHITMRTLTYCELCYLYETIGFNNCYLLG